MITTTNIYISRTFNCSTKQLFDWMVNPKLLAKWFGPKHVSTGMIESDLKVGGNYRIELLKVQGNRFFIEGQYIEIEKPTKLVFSFKYEGLVNTPPDSVVTIIIEEIEPSISKLSLIQKFELAPPDVENKTKAWENMFEKLNTEIKTVANMV